MNIQDEIFKKMQDYEIQRIMDIKSKIMQNNNMTKEISKLKNINMINKEYHDNNTNTIEKDEVIKKISLDDFERNSIRSSFNFYQQSDDGSPIAVRNQKNGYIYKDSSGEVACRLTIETKNEKKVITDFYVSPKYMGYGLSNELLSVAKNNFGVTGAIIHKDNNFCISFLQKNNFYIVGKKKDFIILSLSSENRYNNYLKESVVHKTQNSPVRQQNRPVPPVRQYSNISSNSKSLNNKNNETNYSNNNSNRSTKLSRFRNSEYEENSYKTGSSIDR